LHGAHDSCGIGVVYQRQQQVFQRGILVMRRSFA
jgi:hypothetical protein